MRRLISRGGSLYSRMVLGVPVRDLTGGFKCFHREVLESIDLDTVSASGYSFQVEMTYRTLKAGFEVLEVPITFREREIGDSKMSGSIVIEAAWRVPATAPEGLIRWALRPCATLPAEGRLDKGHFTLYSDQRSVLFKPIDQETQKRWQTSPQ
jgi:dolichol-phosphate mannosyltransferase